MSRRFNLPKSVAHYAQDPTAGLPGDVYYNSLQETFKRYDGTQWVSIGSGPQGLIGSQGTSGSNGVQGTTGLQGLQGTTGSPLYPAPRSTEYIGSRNFFVHDATSSSALPATDVIAVPIVIGESMTLDRISARVVAGGASTTRLGLYAHSTTAFAPGALLVNGGTISTTTGNTTREVTISQAVTPGVYWIAILCSTTTPTFKVLSANGAISQGANLLYFDSSASNQFTSNESNKVFRRTSQTNFPDPFGGAWYDVDGTTAVVPLLAVRRA